MAKIPLPLASAIAPDKGEGYTRLAQRCPGGAVLREWRPRDGAHRAVEEGAMGNFEKLSVLVIGVIIVMILVVALYTWTDNPSGDTAAAPEESALQTPAGPAARPSGRRTPAAGSAGPRSGPRCRSPPDRARGGDAAPAEARREGRGPPRRPRGREPAAETPAGETTDPPADDLVVKPGQTLSHVSSRSTAPEALEADRRAQQHRRPARVRAGTTLVIPAVRPRTGARPGTSPGDGRALRLRPAPGRLLHRQARRHDPEHRQGRLRQDGAVARHLAGELRAPRQPGGAAHGDDPAHPAVVPFSSRFPPCQFR